MHKVVSSDFDISLVITWERVTSVHILRKLLKNVLQSCVDLYIGKRELCFMGYITFLKVVVHCAFRLLQLISK